MNSVNVPLMLPKRMHAEIKCASKETGLNQAEVMRQSIKFGLPKIRKVFRNPQATPALAAK